MSCIGIHSEHPLRLKYEKMNYFFLSKEDKPILVDIKRVLCGGIIFKPIINSARSIDMQGYHSDTESAIH